MADFHFIRPVFLAGFIVLVWLLWQIRRLRVSASAWHQLIPKHLTQKLLNNSGENKPASLFPIAFIGSLFIIALAGPTWHKLPQPVFEVKRGSVLVMDMSFSMLATDIQPNRLTMARFKAIDLVEKIDEGDIGLIAYAGDAFTISPLTPDINNIKLLLPSLSPQIMPELGSNPYPALLLAEEMLSNAGHSQGDIYWFTDGITRDEVEDIQGFVNDSNHRINILAVGTEQGAPITLANGELMKDRRGNIVIPKLTTNSLSALSRNSGGIFTPITADDSDVKKLSALSKLDSERSLESQQQNQGDQWQEFGPYLLLIALPLALGYFRKGVLLTPLLTGLLVTSIWLPGAAHASLWDDLWQTDDQQGHKQFLQQDFTKAAKQFNQPDWQGASYYRAGDYENAIKAFAQSDSEQAMYNSANAYAQLGQLQQALDGYKKVLQQNPQHADAKANKTLVEKLLEQQQLQQNNPSQSTEDQKQSDDQQSQDNQQSQSEQPRQDGQQANDQQGAGEQQSQSSTQQNDQGASKDDQSQQQQGNAGDSSDPQDPSSPPAQPDDKMGRDQQTNKPTSNDNANNADKAQNPQQHAGELNDTEQQQQAKAKQQKVEQTEAADQQSSVAVESDSSAESEQQQRYEQMLRRVTDDPQLLLQNKMRLEYQKRRQNRSSIGVKEKW
ncbi:VWA domain-containing protein [Thalassotalea maritima]|uniref:vWA domain-containing protein n=1 Tax=Thalassotalea maritima TaxID=3242416 RepID=UPI00352798FF